MAKPTILTERGTGEVMYPQTLATLVKTADGGNVDKGLEKAKLALFDDEWTAAGGTVIESGVTYGLNGLNDLTYKEAIEIYALYPLCKARFTNRGGQFAGLNVRTLPPINTDSFFATNYMETFINSKLVTIKFITASNNPIVIISNAQNMFKNCTSLKFVYDTLNFPSGCNISGVFDLCPNLEEVRIKKLTNSIVLSFSPKLSLDSIAYMVENAANTTPITITLHPEVYARVTEELFVHAAEKNITIAST